MVTTLRTGRIAAAAITAPALALGIGSIAMANGSGGQIDFDELVFDGVLTSLSPDHYLGQGVFFGETPYIVDLTIGQPGQLGEFVIGGGTLDNALVLSSGIDQFFMDIYFVVPGTLAPATTDWFSVVAFDTDLGTQLGAIEAYDIDGTLIGFDDAVTDLSFMATLSLAIEGIHRIRLITDADGAFFDSLAFGKLVSASPGDIPAPASIVALALGGLLSRRRRRA